MEGITDLESRLIQETKSQLQVPSCLSLNSALIECGVVDLRQVDLQTFELFT